MCKALGWVGVDVKPIRACLCLWSQRPFLLWCKTNTTLPKNLSDWPRKGPLKGREGLNLSLRFGTSSFLLMTLN